MGRQRFYVLDKMLFGLSPEEEALFHLTESECDIHPDLPKELLFLRRFIMSHFLILKRKAIFLIPGKQDECDGQSPAEVALLLYKALPTRLLATMKRELYIRAELNKPPY